MTLDDVLGPGWLDRANQYSYHGQNNLFAGGGAIPVGNVFNDGKQYFLQRDFQAPSADNGYAAGRDRAVLYTDNGSINHQFDNVNGQYQYNQDYKGNENGITGMDLVRGAATIGAGMGLGAVASAGMAGGAAAGSGAMDAAAASDAGGGSLGGAATSYGGGVSAGGTGLATTTGPGLNPAFDTLGNPADAGITGSQFTPATTQAPLPMDGSYLDSLGTTTAVGPTSGFVPGNAVAPGLSLTTGLGGAGNAVAPAASGMSDLGKAVGGLGTLAQIAGAVQGGNAQKQASNNMLDWLRSQQAKIDGLYQPGSPEYNLLMQQMSAKDAQAGRNSQYGIRSIDLAGKIAQIKAEQTARLTSGIAGNMSTAFNQNASSNAGLNATIGNITKPDANGNSQLSNGISGLSSLGQYF